MLTTLLRIGLFAGLLAVFAGAVGAGTEISLRVDRRALEAMADRQERDTAEKLRAMAVCGSGFSTKDMPHILVACNIAFTHTLHSGEYEQAMHYALLGCKKYRSPGLCRRAGGLPMALGNQGIDVPPAFKADIQRAADAVCLSGKRFRTLNGVDVTARDCNYYARLFHLVKDPEYIYALAPAALRFYESMYEPAHAARLYAAACRRLGSSAGCQFAKEMQAALSSAVAGRAR